MRALMGMSVVLAAATAQAVPTKPLASHCSPAEKVVATCTMKNGKTLSLCASHDLGPRTGFLQYRFGKLGAVPELSFPSTPMHPSRAFQLMRLGGASGGNAELSFRRGAFRYVVYTEYGHGPVDSSGVLVEKGGKTLADIQCRPSAFWGDLWELALNADRYGMTLVDD